MTPTPKTVIRSVAAGCVLVALSCGGDAPTGAAADSRLRGDFVATRANGLPLLALYCVTAYPAESSYFVGGGLSFVDPDTVFVAAGLTRHATDPWGGRPGVFRYERRGRELKIVEADPLPGSPPQVFFTGTVVSSDTLLFGGDEPDITGCTFPVVEWVRKP